MKDPEPGSRAGEVNQDHGNGWDQARPSPGRVSRFARLQIAFGLFRLEGRLGELIQGDEGAALIREADAMFAARLVKSPARYTAFALPAPG